MAYSNKKYCGTGSIGTSMQGSMVYVKDKPDIGKAKCVDCKYLKFGYYCDKRDKTAYHKNKKRKCDYFITK